MLRSFYKLYLMLTISLLVAAAALQPCLEYLFLTRVRSTNDDVMRYTTYQLRNHLMTLPEAQWPTAVPEMEAPFPLIDIDIVPRDELPLSARQYHALDQGMLASTRPNELLLALPPGNMLLRVIQLRSMLAVPIFQVTAWVLVALLLFGSVFLWLRMHWRDLERLSRAADRFGEGDLASRSSLRAHSSVAPLAHRFDSMATRIETLVTTQNEMINAISHELRTPITRFGFGLALLQAADTERERQRQAEALERDVADVEELVSELLSYGALGRSERTLERHTTDLNELIGGVLGSIALEMESLDVTCTVDIDAGAERAVLDSRLTARVLINLAKNAMRYCHGHMAIQVLLKNDRLVIQVDDDGIGIPADERQTIFEPFHRLDRSRDRNTGGFGLGLAIAKRAAVAQGGKLRALASPLGGARFELLLPRGNQLSAIATRSST